MMEMELKIGQLYTVISGPGWKTEKREILVVGFNWKTKTYAYSKRCGIQSYGLIKAAELRFCLVLKGQKLPIKVYPENDPNPDDIRFNFETDDPDMLRACIESTCVKLNRWKRARIFYFRVNNVVTQYSGGVRLFPGIEN
jgi:hypothetical protein